MQVVLFLTYGTIVPRLSLERNGKKHGHMTTIRHALTLVFLILGPVLHAQTWLTTPVGATSATDTEVKIHKTGKIVLFRHLKKSRGQAHVTERAGQSIHRQKA